MNTKKTWTAAAVMALGLMGFGARAWAASPDFDTFQIRIIPNVDLGVTVDTTGSAWAGDTDLYTAMDVSGEKLLGTGVKLTITGNFNKQEVQLQGTQLDTWNLDTDETPSSDLMRLYGLIGADQGAVLPVSADFNGAANLIRTDIAKLAGQPLGNEGVDNNGHVFEFSDAVGAIYADVDDMAVAASRRLWLRANEPSTTTVDVEQKFTITVTAMTGSGQ